MWKLSVHKSMAKSGKLKNTCEKFPIMGNNDSCTMLPLWVCNK